MEGGSDLFSLLCSGGVKFDRQRFGKDISAFHAKQAAAPQPLGQLQARRPQQQQQQKQPAQTSRKRRRPEDAEEEDAGPGIAIFRSTKQQQQDEQSEEEDEDEELNSEEEEEGEEGEAGSEEGEEGLEGDEEDDLMGDSEEEGDEGEEEEAGSGSDGEAAEGVGSEGEEEDEEGGREERRKSGAKAGPSSASAKGIPLDPDCPVVHTNDAEEAANVVRKHYRIKVAGSSAPAPLRSWAELGARCPKGSGAAKAVARLLAGLEQYGYVQPTPIQRQAVPALLDTRELLAVAPTGSGKTLAFLAPILLALQGLKRAGGELWPAAVKAVVLSPTHELAGQQARVLKLLLPGTGLKASLLARSTEAGTDFSKVDILLANPLRLASMAEEGKIDLSQVRYLVLDEADKLFDMGFMEQIDGVLAACTHKDIVRALFSATLPDKVETLARSVLVQPLRITIGARNTAVSNVTQRLLFVGMGEAGKLLALRQLLRDGLKPPVLVFVASKDRAKALHRELLYDGVRVDSINAGQSQAARAAAVDNFRSGKTWVLIATDLIGRGMDFIGVHTVVNYDFPTSTPDYIHRIGRTGRAGRSGEAVTFFTEEDKPFLRPVAHIIKEAGGEVPAWMLALKKVRTKDRRRARLPAAVVSGETISTLPRMARERMAKKRRMQQGQGKRPGQGKKPGQGEGKKQQAAQAGGPKAAKLAQGKSKPGEGAGKAQAEKKQGPGPGKQGSKIKPAQKGPAGKPKAGEPKAIKAKAV